ncbi:hypothetical protein [Actinosynnema sp. NPDC020468]|uniref:hypothetical protein n=1 Tax=Actinosynnema sp. NPDC020468 TaxID=3154488 RepID=UPI0033D08FA2
MRKALLVGFVLSVTAAVFLVTAGGSSGEDVHDKARSDNSVVRAGAVPGVSGKTS